MLRSLALAPLLSLLAIPASALPPPIYKGPIGIGGGGNPCLNCVVEPPRNPPPGKPFYVGASVHFIGGTPSAPRTTNMTVQVGWTNATAATTVAVQRISNLSTVGTVSNVAAGSGSSIIDSHPIIDGTNCYRVVASNAYGSTMSDQVCLLTPDGANRPLWRAQLEVDVANVSDAGTDHDVHARLNSPSGLYGIDFIPSGNETWIDTPGDDFEQSSHNTYELELNRLTDGLPLGSRADISDVKMVTLLLDGDGDAMCVQSVNLILNGLSVFHGTFSQCVWVTPEAPLTVDTATLRSSPAWHAPTNALPTGISYELMNSVATLAVSQQIHNHESDISWRDTYFSDNPETSNYGQFIRNYEWAIDYHDIPLNLQASFEVENTCTGGTSHARLFIADVDVDAASYLELLAPLTEALVNAFAPSFPTLFDTTLNLNIPCTPGQTNLGMCFDSNGLNACFTTF